MRTYEIVFITAPNTTEDDLTKLNSQLDKVVTDLGGTITKTDNWGRKKLAYKIGKYEEGVYVVLYIEGTGSEIAEVERLNVLMVQRALRLGGTCTGEHGIGLHKIAYLVDEAGAGAVAMMRSIKRALDPNNIMNPGKVFSW